MGPFILPPHASRFHFGDGTRILYSATFRLVVASLQKLACFQTFDYDAEIVISINGRIAAVFGLLFTSIAVTFGAVRGASPDGLYQLREDLPAMRGQNSDTGTTERWSAIHCRH